MAYEIANHTLKITLVAGADLSTKQYTFVKLNSAGAAVAVDGATDRPIGVLQNAPTSGQEAVVVVVGGTKLVASAALTEGAVIGTTAAGKGAALTVGTDTTRYILGTNLIEVGADNQITTAVVNCASAGRAA